MHPKKLEKPSSTYLKFLLIYCVIEDRLPQAGAAQRTKAYTEDVWTPFISWNLGRWPRQSRCYWILLQNLSSPKTFHLPESLSDTTKNTARSQDNGCLCNKAQRSAQRERNSERYNYNKASCLHLNASAKFSGPTQEGKLATKFHARPPPCLVDQHRSRSCRSLVWRCLSACMHMLVHEVMHKTLLVSHASTV